MKNKKMIMTILFIILVVLITAVTGIYALFTDKETRSNTMTVGYNNIEIIEDFQPPEEIKPGISFKKDVKVKNTGNCSCYFRVKAVFTNCDMMNYCHIDFNNNNFDYNESDGYYYYKEKINVGDISYSLFTTVSIDENSEQSDLKDFDILIYAESYQSDGFDNYSSAWQNFQQNKNTTV